MSMIIKIPNGRGGFETIPAIKGDKGEPGSITNVGYVDSLSASTPYPASLSARGSTTAVAVTPGTGTSAGTWIEHCLVGNICTVNFRFVAGTDATDAGGEWRLYLPYKVANATGAKGGAVGHGALSIAGKGVFPMTVVSNPGWVYADLKVPNNSANLYLANIRRSVASDPAAPSYIPSIGSDWLTAGTWIQGTITYHTA